MPSTRLHSSAETIHVGSNKRMVIDAFGAGRFPPPFLRDVEIENLHTSGSQKNTLCRGKTEVTRTFV